MLEGHGGQLPFSADGILDFSVSVNPFPDLSVLGRAMETAMKEVGRYPDPLYSRLRKVLGEKYGLAPERILAGNGSTELLYLIPRALAPKNVSILSPSYADYADSARSAGAEVKRIFVKPGETFNGGLLSNEAALADMVIIGNPNNPTGSVTDKTEITEAAKRNPGTFFIIDESFADFAPGISLLGSSLPNLIVVRSFTKFYGVPGLRLGFCAADEKVIGKLLEAKEPWTINCAAEAWGMEIAAGNNDEAIRAATTKAREGLFAGLKGITGLEPFPSKANFILTRITDNSLAAGELKHRLLEKKVLIRDCSNFAGLDGSFFRVGVRGDADNMLFLSALRSALKK